MVDENEEVRRDEPVEPVEADDGAPRKVRAAAIREEDIEPYTALRWVSTLFKAAAIFLVIAMIGESVAGIKMGGSEVLPLLLGELARTVVFIVVLWGAGDLVRLLIDLGHDIRAQRVLLARMAYRLREEADKRLMREAGRAADVAGERGGREL